MQAIQQWFARASDLVWGLPIILLLVGTGIYFTILLRGLQFRELKHSLCLHSSSGRKKGRRATSHTIRR